MKCLFRCLCGVLSAVAVLACNGCHDGGAQPEDQRYLAACSAVSTVKTHMQIAALDGALISTNTVVAIAQTRLLADNRFAKRLQLALDRLWVSSRSDQWADALNGGGGTGSVAAVVGLYHERGKERFVTITFDDHLGTGSGENEGMVEIPVR